MDSHNPRDPELDEILSPLRSTALSAEDLTRILTNAGIPNSPAPRPLAESKLRTWSMSLAFAAGLAVGILATALMLKNQTSTSDHTVAEENFEEFATVRHIVAN
jgi:hypothetical protein